MNDKGLIIVGLVVFLALVAFPVWYNVAEGQADYVPELEIPVGVQECVMETEYMKANHMDLLNDWRDCVVRDGERMTVDQNGHEVEMSLTRTCLGCHTNKEAFCNRCHDYLGIEPYCWGCHVDPKEVQ
ncbi:MAG: sulfate reduction electron transfer complex DsrMKJOP subunit DsrJ [candidate division Zixibacteria bacterium]|nr:sulfate reduction electron transfer complex DsrMKJOP subunit DsrJ [candidate division Zixibacteria bacterium]